MNTTQTTKTTHCDGSLHNNRDISNKYTIRFRNKFNTLQEKFKTLALNDEYENFTDPYMEAALECIPTKLRAKHRVLWEILTVREKQENMKTVSLCNKRNLTNVNTWKAQNEQINAYQKEQIEYIQGQIDKIRNSEEDRQSYIAWQT